MGKRLRFIHLNVENLATISCFFFFFVVVVFSNKIMIYDHLSGFEHLYSDATEVALFQGDGLSDAIRRQRASIAVAMDCLTQTCIDSTRFWATSRSGRKIVLPIEMTVYFLVEHLQATERAFVARIDG